MITDEVKLTQTFTILRYFGRKHKLDGQTTDEQTAISLLEHQLSDFFGLYKSISHEQNQEKFELAKESYLETTLPVQLAQLEQWMEGKDWLVGEQLTYVDFFLYEYLVIMKCLAEELFLKFNNLIAFVKRFEALPAVAKYIEKMEPMPFNGPWAKWNALY